MVFINVSDVATKYRCTNCQEDLPGIRVHCVECVDFDLCLQVNAAIMSFIIIGAVTSHSIRIFFTMNLYLIVVVWRIDPSLRFILRRLQCWFCIYLKFLFVFFLLECGIFLSVIVDIRINVLFNIFFWKLNNHLN